LLGTIHGLSEESTIDEGKLLPGVKEVSIGEELEMLDGL
jgi:hypothetical protein